MTQAQPSRRAWGGDAARKAAAVAAVAAAQRADPDVFLYPVFMLAEPGDAKGSSQLFCSAFGTADPAELESRSGVDMVTLRVICSVLPLLYTFEPGKGDDQNQQRIPTPASVDSAARAFEAIPVGADLDQIPRHYLQTLLADLTPGALLCGQALAPASEAARLQVAALHASESTDASAYRTARRAAMSAADAATTELDADVLKFVESVAWPTGSVVGELPELAGTLHGELADALGRECLTAEERRVLLAARAKQKDLVSEFQRNPALGYDWLDKVMKECPEVVAGVAPELIARRQRAYNVTIEAYAPRAMATLLRALGGR